MEVDHVFMFVEQDGPELSQLKSLGLVETYRRQHHGQGTANACFCFDNMFIEMLWIVDPIEALSAPIARTGLEPRSRWKTAGTCPFGIAWRDNGKSTIETWDFAPPYLPFGVTIDVASDGDDPRQPMMFSFPGTKAPSTWEPVRKGVLQQEAGFQTISQVTLTLPFDVKPSSALKQIAARCDPPLFIQQGAKYGLGLVLAGREAPIHCQFG